MMWYWTKAKRDLDVSLKIVIFSSDLYFTASFYLCQTYAPGAAIIGGTGGTRPPKKFWLGGRKCKHPPNNCHF